jgi:toxin FitB
LDTNVPSELVRPHPEPRVKAWVAAQSLDALFMSAVSFGELRRGIILRAPGKRRTELELWLETDLSIVFSGRILPVTKGSAPPVVRRTHRQCQLKGQPINAPDGLIAATALEHDLTVVTRNVKHFAGLGVEILNPRET